MRNSLDYAVWKDRKLVVATIRPSMSPLRNSRLVRRCTPSQPALEAPPGYPTIVAAWRRAWEHVVPFFIFPSDIRGVIYTADAIGNMNRQLRKTIKNRGQRLNNAKPPRLQKSDTPLEAIRSPSTWAKGIGSVL